MSIELSNEDREEIQYDACMRLVDGVILHILDIISISDKWTGKNIGLTTLVAKRNRLLEFHKWFKTNQWSVWVNIYAEDKNISNILIKKKFNTIRRASMINVNKRIKIKIQNKNKKSIRQIYNTRKTGYKKTKTQSKKRDKK